MCYDIIPGIPVGNNCGLGGIRQLILEEYTITTPLLNPAFVNIRCNILSETTIQRQLCPVKPSSLAPHSGCFQNSFRLETHNLESTMQIWVSLERFPRFVYLPWNVIG